MAHRPSVQLALREVALDLGCKRMVVSGGIGIILVLVHLMYTQLRRASFSAFRISEELNCLPLSEASGC